MAFIFLIRHGQNDLVGKKLAGRLPDVHLNPQGQKQARQLAAMLAGKSIKAVFSSPLERTQETAQPIARVHDLPVELLPGLFEIDYGQWQGKSLKQLKRNKIWKSLQENPKNFSFPDGESFVDAQSRAVGAIDQLSESYAEKEVLVCVSHCDVIRLVIAHYLGMPLKNFHQLNVAPASVTGLFLNQGKVLFDTINLTYDGFSFSE